MNSCEHKQVQELDFTTKTVLRCMQKRKDFRVKAICAGCKRRVEMRYGPIGFRVIGGHKSTGQIP
jgi:hypothetical protein